MKLVDHLPIAPPEDPDVPLVIIRTYPSVLEADLAKNALEGAGIDTALTTEGGIRRNYLGLDLKGIGLLVRAEDAEGAGKILDGDTPGN